MIYPDEFLCLAKRLNDGCKEIPATEASIRTSISRAYFFVLLKIRGVLESKGFSFSKSRDAHDEVVKALYQQSTTCSVAMRLSALRKKRNDADYELMLQGYGYGSSKAEAAIGESEQLSSIFDSIHKSQLRK